MNSKHAKTKAALFENPVRRDLRFTKVKVLLLALGAQILQREGSRVKITIDRFEVVIHAPHGTEPLKPYQVHALRKLLIDTGVKP